MLVGWTLRCCWFCALILAGSAFLCARPVAAQSPQRLEGLRLAPDSLAAPEEMAEPPLEEEESWLPHLTLPHADSWEQLYRPGDLVEDTYFLRRPWHAGFLVGTMDGDRLTSGVDQQTDWFDGLRFGNDFSPCWGWEVRSAFFSPDLTYTTPTQHGFARDWFLDLNAVHYPWGDTRIRPFWSLGLGGAQFKFVDEHRRDISEWLVDLPLSIGCKYQCKPWLTLRGELTDTFVFGNDNVDTLNNLSFSVGAEVHWHSFKTRPVRYGY